MILYKCRRETPYDINSVLTMKKYSNRKYMEIFIGGGII